MEAMPDDTYFGEFLVAHLDALLVLFGIESRFDYQSLPCRRRGDQADDRLSTHERVAPPVLRENLQALCKRCHSRKTKGPRKNNLNNSCADHRGEML